MLKINILLCDVFEDIMPFEDINYLSMIKSLFDSVSSNIKYEVFEAFARDLPDVIEEDAIYLIPGSRADAYSDMPWLVELRHFIEELYEDDAKMIGICFGHQLIAETLGGRVEKAVAGYGIGAREAVIYDSKMKKAFPDGILRLFNFHQDQVVILPPEATLLAGSTFCPIEAYAIGKNIFSIQGHPEYDSSYMRYILKNHSDKISEIMRIKAIKTLQEPTHKKEIIQYIFDYLEVN